MAKLKIHRGNKASNQTDAFVPEEGELFYSIDTKELFCGDGINQIKDLKGIGCIAKSPNGRLYSIEVDDNGNAKATPLLGITKKPNRKFELYGE